MVPRALVKGLPMPFTTRRSPVIVLLIALLVLGAFPTLTLTPSARASAGTAALPSDLVQEIVAGGLTLPTALTFLPDGRILIAEKPGTVRVVKGGNLLPTPFLDISAHVNDYEDRGLLGIAADKDFTTNGYVYLLYTYEHLNKGAANYRSGGLDAGRKTARLTRVTATGDVAGGGETPILGTLVAGMTVPGTSTVAQGCSDFARGADCLPSDGIIHSIGTVKTASDGTLFGTIGDSTINGSTDNPFRAQDLDILAGKVLHITTGGAGLTTNPYYDSGHGIASNRAKVWAQGMRNPFRLNLRPGVTPPVPYLGDVGWDTAEEINVATAGANLGWPCYEGDARQATFQSDPFCQTMYANNVPVKAPLISYPHTDDTGATVGSAVVGGTFYSGTTFPAEYRGAYFYADYARDFIRYLKVDANNTLTQAPRDIFLDTGAPVDLEMNAADGTIYFLALNTGHGSIDAGQLRRIRPYDASIPDCSGGYLGEYFNNATLSGNPTLRRCDAGIAFDWGTGSPDSRLNSDDFSVRWTGNFTFAAGTYMFSGDADDGIRVFIDGTPLYDAFAGPPGPYSVSRAISGDVHQVKVEYNEIAVGAHAIFSWQQTSANQAPTATITAPGNGTTFAVGDTISFTGKATDPEDAPTDPGIADAQLSWSVILQHCPGGGACHQHPVASVTGRSGSFTAADHGDDTYYTITLTATDSGGQTATTTRVVRPRTMPLTLNTSPAGLQLTYVSTTVGTPCTQQATVGGQRLVTAPTPQIVNGTTYDFVGWSDGGAVSHSVAIGTTPLNLVATFTARPTSNPTPTPSPIALTIAQASGGTAAATPSGPYASGAQVTLAATPTRGYLFLGWQVTCRNGLAFGSAPPVCTLANPLTLTLTADTTVTPVFAPAPTFSDSPATHPAATAITELAARGIIHGYQDGTFGPGDNIAPPQDGGADRQGDGLGGGTIRATPSPIAGLSMTISGGMSGRSRRGVWRGGIRTAPTIRSTRSCTSRLSASSPAP